MLAPTAVEAEREQERTSKPRKVVVQSTTTEATQKPKPKGKGRMANANKRTCWNCGQKGHTIYSCTEEWDRERVLEAMDSHKAKFQARTKSSENSQRD